MCNSCPSLCKSPESGSWFGLQPDSAQSESAAAFHEVSTWRSECAAAGSGDPIGVCSERGIITYLPLISASVAIQPSVLPAARLSAALPLETEEGVSHALTGFHWTTGWSIKIGGCATPRELSMNGRIFSHSWIAHAPPPTPTPTHTRLGLNLLSMNPIPPLSDWLIPV